MFVTINGYSRSFDINFDSNTPISFEQVLGDAHSKADLSLTDTGIVTLGTASFAQPNQAGWNPATDGQNWQALIGNPTLSISGNLGVVLNLLNVFTPIVLGSQVAADQDITVSLAASSPSTTEYGVVLRVQNSGTFYAAFLFNGYLYLYKFLVSGDALVAYIPFTTTANTYYQMHARIVGSNLFVSAWPFGSPEPTNWTLIGQDTSITGPGQYGAYGTSTTSNADTIYVDNFNATIPVIPPRIDVGQEVIIWDETTPPEKTISGRIIAATPAHNLLRSSLTLTDTSNWIASSGALQSLVVASGATITMTFNNSVLGSGGLLQTTSSGYIHPGQSYMLSAYISSTSPVNIQSILKIEFLDSTGTLIPSATMQNVSTPPTTQQQLSIAAVAPQTAAYIRVTIGAQTTVAGTNSGAVQLATVQLEPMYFVAEGVSYPTNDCNYAQADCTQMPDGTISRTARLFSGYIDSYKVAYGGPNRIWEVSCASSSVVLENDALINLNVVNRYDDLIITSIVNTYFPGILSITAANQVAPAPLVRGSYITSVSWVDISFRDIVESLADLSGYTYRINEYYQLEYHPSYYQTTSFSVVAAISADGITTIAPEDYSYEKDATQRKRQIKVIGAPYLAPFFIQSFTGDGTTTQFNLFQIPYEVRNISVAGVQQVVGIQGINNLGDVISAGTITVLVNQPFQYLLFATAPASGAAITCEYDYNGPVTALVLDQSTISNPVAPAYAIPAYAAKLHETSITDIPTATQRGLAELTKSSSPVIILKFKTYQLVFPGMAIFFTSSLDQLSNQSFIVRTVTGHLLGPGLNRYEVECSDHPLPSSATTLIRHAHTIHSKGRTVANVTVAQATDLVFSEFVGYSDSVTIKVIPPNPSTWGSAHWGQNTWS